MKKKISPPATAPTTPTSAPTPPAALIVFGLDDANKSHASWFGAADAELAERAAGLMGLQVLPVTTDEHRAVASGLPAGRVFASGKGFVPYCSAVAHDRLQAFEGAFSPAAPVEVPLPAIVGAPATWADIGPGALVLAAEAEGQGWYEAIVAEDRGDDLFVLRWQDWPDVASFVRRRGDLALLQLPTAPH